MDTNKKIKEKFECFLKIKNIQISESDRNNFFRTYLTKGEKNINNIIDNEFKNEAKIDSFILVKKIKEYINLKNKTVNDILYIEEFLKSYYQLLFDKEICCKNKKWVSWNDICTAYEEKKNELENYTIETFDKKLKEIRELRNQLSHHQIYKGSFEDFKKNVKNNFEPIKKWIRMLYKTKTTNN